MIVNSGSEIIPDIISVHSISEDDTGDSVAAIQSWKCWMYRPPWVMAAMSGFVSPRMSHVVLRLSRMDARKGAKRALLRR